MLNYLALEVSDGNYAWVNLFLLLASIPLLVLPIYIRPDRDPHAPTSGWQLWPMRKAPNRAASGRQLLATHPPHEEGDHDLELHALDDFHIHAETHTD